MIATPIGIPIIIDTFIPMLVYHCLIVYVLIIADIARVIDSKIAYEQIALVIHILIGIYPSIVVAAQVSSKLHFLSVVKISVCCGTAKLQASFLAVYKLRRI